MTTTTLTTRSINNLSVSVYGVPVVELPAVAGLWLAERLAASGHDGRTAWRKVDAIMRKAGRAAAFPSYGSVCF